MKLRNYTSSVPVDRSVSEIERLLVDAGATHVARSYKDGSISGFVFVIEIDGGRKFSFKLPANPEAVRRLFEKGLKRVTQTTLRKVREQADRTAWKLLHEWVHIQVSLIQMGQAEAMQVFLPYAYDARKEKTIYELYQGTNFEALPGSKGDE